MNRKLWMRSSFRPLSVSIIYKTIILSTLIALSVIAVQVYLSYYQAKKEFKNSLQNIAQISVPQLSDTLWDIEPEIVHRQLKAIAMQPQIGYILLSVRNGPKFEEGRWKNITDTEPEHFIIPYPSHYPGSIAIMDIWPDNEMLKNYILHQISIMIAGYTIMTLMFCIMVVLVLNKNLLTPMRQISNFIIELSPGSLTKKFEIKRKEKYFSDEIDLVVDGFKIFQSSLKNRIEELEFQISERTKEQNKLFFREQEYKSLLDNSPDWILRYDKNFNLLYENPAFSSARNLKIHEFIDNQNIEKNSKDFYKYLKSILEQKIRDAFRSLNNAEFEIELANNSSLHLVVAVSLTLEKNSQGEYSTALVTARDISSSKKIEIQLKNSRNQLRELTAHMEAIREIERKKIAREIHDEFAQILTTLRLNIRMLESQFCSTNVKLKENINYSIELIDHGIKIVRNVVSAMRPAELDLGIIEALKWQFDLLSKNTGISCSFQTFGEDINLNETHTIVIFRIVQESLTNIVRHSKAKNVICTITYFNQVCTLEIADDGEGFLIVECQKHKTFGLAGMKERALMLGGKLDIFSSPGNGTLIRLSINITCI